MASNQTHIHKEIFSAAKDTLTKVIAAAKKDFLSKQISQAENSQRALFKCMDSLLNRNKSSKLPDVKNSSELADSLTAFFEAKVKKIRDELSLAQEGLKDQKLQMDSKLSRLASFREISEDELNKIILEAPTKTCQLDPIPTRILKECIEPLLPTLLKIINTSLTTSTVPATFKKALVTPLLKKPNLDHNVLKTIDQSAIYHSSQKFLKSSV